MMQVDLFKEEDLQKAVALAFYHWGAYFESEALGKQITELIVRYNLLNLSYSYKIEAEGDLKALALAGLKSDAAEIAEWFEQSLLALSPKDQTIARSMLNYYSTYTKKVQACMTEQDMMLALFMSKEKGCGKLLLNQLVERGMQEGLNNIYLWTDTNCDHEYYARNQFELVTKDLGPSAFDPLDQVETYIYKKRI